MGGVCGGEIRSGLKEREEGGGAGTWGVGAEVGNLDTKLAKLPSWLNLAGESGYKAGIKYSTSVLAGESGNQSGIEVLDFRV